MSDVSVLPPAAATTVRRWAGMRSEHGWTPPSDQVTVSGPRQIGVSFAAHERVVAESGGRTRTFGIRPGDVFATGRHRVVWSEVTVLDEWLEIYPDASLLCAAAGTSTAPEIRPAFATRDAVVLGIASVLKQAHVHDEPLDDVRSSSLAHRLAEHLVSRYCGVRPAPRPRPVVLDQVTLDRVADLVEARLGDRLSLGDLATAAAVSPFHFARAFKASTGMAPHQFVTSRRVERAKTLLLGTHLPVPEVAYAVGYSNLSHFRRIFHRYTGLKPAELRSL